MSGGEFLVWLAVGVCIIIVLRGLLRDTIKWGARQVMDETKKKSDSDAKLKESGPGG